MKKIYMDHAATTQPDPEVVKAMLPYLKECYGNASSLHSWGRTVKKELDGARGKIARLLGAEQNEIIFTGGGTESNNIAIQGLTRGFRKKIGENADGPHIITTEIEHPSVYNTCRELENEGVRTKFLGVDEYGLIDIRELEKSIGPATFLISIIYGNNEVGTVQEIEKIGALARKKSVLLHTDAVQAVGKVDIDVKKKNIDLLSLSSHKIYGPKGIGALYVRRGLRLKPIIYGGGHERGLRSSTENIPAIMGLARAAELAGQRMEEDVPRMKELRDRVIRNILERIEQSTLNGHPTRRLANNVNIRFAGIEGEALILSLDALGIAASTGSACSSKNLKASRILLALGMDAVDAHGSLRLTLGRNTNQEEIDHIVDELIGVVGKLRSMSPLWKN